MTALAGWRIAVATTEFPSASQTFVHDHVAALVGRGAHVDVAATRRGSGDHAGPARVAHVGHVPPTPSARLAAAWHSAGLRVLPRIPVLKRLNHAPQGEGFGPFANALPFLRHASDYRIVHCHFGNRALQLLPLYDHGLLRAPLVVTFHGYDLQGYLQERSAAVYRPLFERARSLIATGPYMRELLLSVGAPAGRITTIANGVRTDLIRCAPRAALVSGEPLRLLTVGRLVEKKGIAFGLDAAADLVRGGVALRYTIIGDGPLKRVLAERARDLGIAAHVQFLGSQSHSAVLQHMQEAHLLLSPGVVAATGDVETQGVALLEAMASGLPLVATAVGGVVHTVPEGTGMLVPPGDVAALAAAVRSLLAEPARREALARAGRIQAEQVYDQRRNFDRLAGHYEALQ